MMVHVARLHLVHATAGWASGARSTNTRGWLFAIIKCLQHACIWAWLWQQEVILEDPISTWSLANYSIDLFWSIILQVLHESALGLVHHVLLVWRASAVLALFVRVIKSCCSCIWICTEISNVYVFVSAHGHETIILNRSVALFETVTVLTSAHRPAAVWKFASLILFIWLVQLVSMTISRWLPSSTDCSVVASVIVHLLGVSEVAYA